MSIKDKLEIGLKPDAPYRDANLPDTQQDHESCEDGASPDSDHDTRRARAACDRGEPESPADGEAVPSEHVAPASSDTPPRRSRPANPSRPAQDTPGNPD
ncbi:MAG: hypothetical protein AB7G23_15420 [Vicinamibacterales bacterium]